LVDLGGDSQLFEDAGARKLAECRFRDAPSCLPRFSVRPSASSACRKGHGALAQFVAGGERGARRAPGSPCGRLSLCRTLRNARLSRLSLIARRFYQKAAVPRGHAAILPCAGTAPDQKWAGYAFGPYGDTERLLPMGIKGGFLGQALRTPLSG
jgi:hypothetical protein